jgi:hypothetical protein
MERKCERRDAVRGAKVSMLSPLLRLRRERLRSLQTPSTIVFLTV